MSRGLPEDVLRFAVSLLCASIEWDMVRVRTSDARWIEAYLDWQDERQPPADERPWLR